MAKAWKCDRCTRLFDSEPWKITLEGTIRERETRWFDFKYTVDTEDLQDLCKDCRNDMRKAIAEILKKE